MAYAEWFVGTSELTSTSKFGVGGWWVKVPEKFPAIQYLEETSLNIGAEQAEGFIVEMQLTTTGIGGSTTLSYVTETQRRGITSYLKGERWLRATSDPCLPNTAGPLAKEDIVGAVKLRLYYRSVGEGGEIT